VEIMKQQKRGKKKRGWRWLLMKMKVVLRRSNSTWVDWFLKGRG
jgi:hypothetical protein